MYVRLFVCSFLRLNLAIYVRGCTRDYLFVHFCALISLKRHQSNVYQHLDLANDSQAVLTLVDHAQHQITVSPIELARQKRKLVLYPHHREDHFTLVCVCVCLCVCLCVCVQKAVYCSFQLNIACFCFLHSHLHEFVGEYLRSTYCGCSIEKESEGVRERERKGKN